MLSLTSDHCLGTLKQTHKGNDKDRGVHETADCELDLSELSRIVGLEGVVEPDFQSLALGSGEQGGAVSELGEKVPGACRQIDEARCFGKLRVKGKLTVPGNPGAASELLYS